MILWRRVGELWKDYLGYLSPSLALPISCIFGLHTTNSSVWPMCTISFLRFEKWDLENWPFVTNQYFIIMGIGLGQHLNRKFFAPTKVKYSTPKIWRKFFFNSSENRNSKLPITNNWDWESKDTRLGGYWKYIWLSWLTSLTHSCSIVRLFSFSPSNKKCISGQDKKLSNKRITT